MQSDTELCRIMQSTEFTGGQKGHAVTASNVSIVIDDDQIKAQSFKWIDYI